MCGIAGIWHLNDESIPEGKLELFTNTMESRGPDGFGFEFYEQRTIGLGHRRLSILDLSEAGHQPMTYGDGRYVITYNGEIYNFRELKKELEKGGFHFITDTDTEIILASFIHWGEACLHKFNGMWAFAIWDQQEKELFISRDRFGIKPLYFVFQPDTLFAFASETKPFKYLQGYQREFDHDMIQFAAGHVKLQGAGYSIYKGIYMILPGHLARVKKDDKELEQRRWWDIRSHLRAVPKTLSAQAEEYYSIFRDSCKMRLVSDVPVATALSGGLDSTSIYSTVNDILRKESLDRIPIDSQQAFVCTFPGLISDERSFAEEALKFNNGKAVFIEQNYPNLSDQIIKDTLAFDGLSFAPITAISSIYRGMKDNGITVSLDGHGVDEMMYGYRDMVYNLFYYYYKKGDNKKVKEIRDILLPTFHDSEYDRVNSNLQRLVKEAESPINRIKAFAKELTGKHEYYYKEYRQNEKLMGLGQPYDFSSISYPERMLYKETFVDTLPKLLRDFDRAAMMSGVEIRMPFMDWRLVSYTFSLPVQSKLGRGYNKLILREAMKGKMAEKIRTRTYKIGIGSPVEHWFQNGLKDWALDTLNASASQTILGSKDLVARLKKAYDSNTLDSGLIYEAWHEINLQLIK